MRTHSPSKQSETFNHNKEKNPFLLVLGYHKRNFLSTTFCDIQGYYIRGLKKYARLTDKKKGGGII